MDRNPRIQRNPPPQHLHQMESPATPEPDLPHVLVLKKPPYFSVTADHHITSTKFRYLNAFDSTLPLHEFLAAHARTPVRAMLASSRATVDAAVLDLLPELRVIVTTSAGVNHVDLTECRRRGIKIANAGDTYSNEGADCAVGLLIDVLRKISAGNRYVKGGLWSPIGDYPLGSKVSGKRIGIVGLGKIGYQVAKRLEAFDCIISYNSRNPKPNVPYKYYKDINEMAVQSDVLILCCGLTALTRHMVNAQVMDALGKDGVIINVARGAVIDEAELVRRLVGGEIAGAGLDVFENEPDVPEELKLLDNVVLSPHCGIASVEAMVDLSRLVVGNLEAFFAGQPLLSEYLDD
ncbi:Glyoxylate/hydroxypyruvate reductase HPR3 [Linum grandiflorum]